MHSRAAAADTDLDDDTDLPDETDPEGQRGLLGWHFDLAPGAKREILLEAKLRWPAGMELR